MLPIASRAKKPQNKLQSFSHVDTIFYFVRKYRRPQSCSYPPLLLLLLRKNLAALLEKKFINKIKNMKIL
jgi:hypothetical protein